ncbi:MAG: hypothetical protein ACYCSX_12430, partial [Acidimicrobiales bacterium]
LVHLAARMPAAVLAELINLHPTTAVHWVRAAGGDWSTYAAMLCAHQLGHAWRKENIQMT